MKILIHGINFAPEFTGVGKYTGEMAAWLAAAGHEVRVVTAPPYYPEWKVRKGYHARRYTYEEWNKVRVWRAPLWVPARPTSFKRLLHLASFAICSLPLMLLQIAWKPDVVWVVEPPLLCAPTALCVAWLTGARAWLHVQDYEVDVAFALGLLQGSFAARIVNRIERKIMRCFHNVSTICMSMMDRALAKGVCSDRLMHFPNWIDLDSIHPLERVSSYRAELGIPEDAVVALYSGNMGRKQGLDIMADAARILAGETGLCFVFCGNGVGKKELMRMVQDLPNVQFLDLQPVARLNDLLGLADIHLLPQNAHAAGLVMPSKLSGLMASGRTVVATADVHTELGQVVQSCGVTVSPGDAEAFANAISRLARDSAQRKTFGLAGRKYAEIQFNITRILDEFEKSLGRRC
jgi:colanic acid biosynthesis glycosyl transferase WcaI